MTQSQIVRMTLGRIMLISTFYIVPIVSAAVALASFTAFSNVHEKDRSFNGTISVERGPNMFNASYGEKIKVKIFYDRNLIEKCPPAFPARHLGVSFEIIGSPSAIAIHIDGCFQFNLEDKDEPCRNYTNGGEYLIACPGTPVGDTIPFSKCNSIITSQQNVIENSRGQTTTIIVAVVVIILSLFIAVAFVVRYRMRTAKIAEQLEIEKYIRSLSVNSVSSIKLPKRRDHFEIERRMIHINEGAPIGRGAFGVVFLGRIIGRLPISDPGESSLPIALRCRDHKCVAIKTLSETAGETAHSSFIQEIRLMKTIGYHDRLTNLLACVTESDPPYLVMEYCSNGDLKHYLRKRREHTLSVIAEKDQTRERTQNKDSSESEGDAMLVTPRQQLGFAHQTATALEYLSNRGFVHRDVAARNVMVDEHVSCKLGDFGLCRNVEDVDYYIGKGGRLPVKWMPPEAISENRFTVASDAWSFGVLLYEIFSLGAAPYKDVPTAEMLPKLQAGYRMERPTNCPNVMYVGHVDEGI